MNYRKVKTLSTNIETAVADICSRLEKQGFKYERYNNYIPRYIEEEGDYGEPVQVVNTDENVGTGYAWIKYYYEDRKFGYIFICCHRVNGCSTCAFDRYITIYNYTDDIADSNIPGDVPILAIKPLPADESTLDETTLYYKEKTFRPILSASEICTTCSGTGGIECTACSGKGIVEYPSETGGDNISATCTLCNGLGHYKSHHECTSCNGTGKIKYIKSVDEYTQEPTYGYSACSECDGIGAIADYCADCRGLGYELDSVSWGAAYNLYHFYMDKYRDEDGMLISFQKYPNRVSPILNISQVTPLDNSVYVLYNENAIIDNTHKDEHADDIYAQRLEYYLNDYTENCSNTPAKTNVITSIGNAEAQIANYAQHCIIKTFPSFDDIDSVMNYVLYKDKNRPILPVNNDINYAAANWNIDYSFENGANNNFQLINLGNTYMGCDYTSFDLSAGDNNSELSAYFIKAQFTTDSISANSTYTKDDEDYYFIELNKCTNKTGNLNWDYSGTYNRIIHDPNSTLYLGGELTIDNFIATSGTSTGDLVWSAFKDYVSATNNGILQDVGVTFGYCYNTDDTTVKWNDLVDIPLESIVHNVYSAIPSGAQDPITKEWITINKVIDYYKTWTTNYRVSIQPDNTIAKFNNVNGNLAFGLYPYYTYSGTSTSGKVTNPSILSFNSTFAGILVTNISEDAAKELSPTLMDYAFRLPYVDYNYNNYMVGGQKCSQTYPTTESCYNLYWPEYGNNINSFKWYIFNDKYIDINKPDTYELHETHKKEYFNFITRNKLKSIYTKVTDSDTKTPASIYNAFRITCPTCSGNYINTYSARCRCCAGSRKKQNYYYYECNEFRDASKYISGHAEECVLSATSAIPDIDDAQKVKIDGVESAYLDYAMANYYNVAPGVPHYAELSGKAAELVKENTVLYKFNGDVNKYYWWDGTKHVEVNMGYKFIYKTKTVTKDCLILQDPSDKSKCIPGKDSMNFNTMEVLYNDNTVLYRVLLTLSDIDNTIGFFGYNLATSAYERIFMYNPYVYDKVKASEDDFNYLTFDSTIISAGNHIDSDPLSKIHFGSYTCTACNGTGKIGDETCTTCEGTGKITDDADDLDKRYYYKYKSKGEMTFDNLSFEVDQNFITLE